MLDIDQLRIGNNCSIGFRRLFDARSGIVLKDNVVLASDVQMLGGGHDPNDPDFGVYMRPIIIDDYAWIAILFGRNKLVKELWVICWHERRGAG